MKRIAAELQAKERLILTQGKAKKNVDMEVEVEEVVVCESEDIDALLVLLWEEREIKENGVGFENKLLSFSYCPK